jgi:hypothetical protein
MPAPRTVGHRGRNRVRPPARRFKISYLDGYMRTPLPPARYPVDVSGGITEWKMLGNGPDPSCTTHPSGVSDCTFAGRQHNRMAKAKAGREVERWETSDELVAEYLAYDGGKDGGATIADLLLFWYRKKVILGFAPVDHTDPAAVDAAMAAFHGAYVGVYLTDDAETLFEKKEPWSTSHGQKARRADGHCILKVKADGQALDCWVTWGALQESTREWTRECVDEAWVIITQEDADAVDLDIAALRKDIDALDELHGAAAARGDLT